MEELHGAGAVTLSEVKKIATKVVKRNSKEPVAATEEGVRLLTEQLSGMTSPSPAATAESSVISKGTMACRHVLRSLFT